MSASRTSKSERVDTIKANIKGFFGSWAKTLINLLDPCCPTQVKKFTTTERDALDVAEWEGAIIYNTTTNKLNFSNGTAWEVVTSS